MIAGINAGGHIYLRGSFRHGHILLRSNDKTMRNI